MTEPTRGARARRGHRRPGSLLLTILLVLAIIASSALVFTNRVELLKLAVIVALWAAVVAAFVSFIYRRQADLDHAKSRDLKLVYDLQLDREISARREYELSIEAQLRRELASEMRAETSDEVASLRAELAALRANLEMIFDTDLQSRPAIETERTTVHRFGDWNAAPQGAAAPEHGERNVGPERVISSRIDTEAPDDTDPSTEESPIIDVPIEPQPPEGDWAPQVPGGAHRRPSEPEPVDAGWRPPRQEEPAQEGRRRAPEPVPDAASIPTPEVGLPWMPVDPPPEPTPPQPDPPRRASGAGTRRQACTGGIGLAPRARRGGVHPGRRAGKQLGLPARGEGTSGPAAAARPGTTGACAAGQAAGAGDDGASHRNAAAGSALHRRWRPPPRRPGEPVTRRTPTPSVARLPSLPRPRPRTPHLPATADPTRRRNPPASTSVASRSPN